MRTFICSSSYRPLQGRQHSRHLHLGPLRKPTKNYNLLTEQIIQRKHDWNNAILSRPNKTSNKVWKFFFIILKLISHLKVVCFLPNFLQNGDCIANYVGLNILTNATPSEHVPARNASFLAERKGSIAFKLLFYKWVNYSTDK